jgi:hypothetical protein
VVARSGYRTHETRITPEKPHETHDNDDSPDGYNSIVHVQLSNRRGGGKNEEDTDEHSELYMRW